MEVVRVDGIHMQMSGPSPSLLRGSDIQVEMP